MKSGLRQLSEKAGAFCAGLSFRSAFFFFFLLLLLCNAAWLFNPPHWDEIIGVHNQALFLLKHHFHFWKLWTAEQHTFEGSNVYPYSLIPVFYALLYGILPPEWVHFCGHLLNNACIAGAAAFFFLTLRGTCGIAGGTAALWTLAALAEPLIAGRGTALGLECALICALSAVIWLVSQKRFYWALGVLLFSGFLKPSGSVLALAFLVAFLVRMIPERREWRRNLPVLICAGVCFLILFLMMSHNISVSSAGVHVPGGGVRDGGSSTVLFLCRKLYFHYELYFPVLFSVLAVGIFWSVFRLFAAPERNRERMLFQLFLLLTAGGYLGAYLLSKTALPRYMAVVSFPAYLLLASNWKWKPKTTAVLILFTGFLAPAFYKRLPFGIRRSGEYLERSREYLADIDANRRLCRFLEAYREAPIVAPWPIVQMLTMPEMGYVKKPFPLVHSGLVPFYAPVRKLEKPFAEMPEDTVFVFQENDWENTRTSNPSLLPGRDTFCLWKDSTLGGLTLVYRLRK